jgi:hypothetical protein
MKYNSIKNLQPQTFRDAVTVTEIGAGILDRDSSANK